MISIPGMRCKIEDRQGSALNGGTGLRVQEVRPKTRFDELVLRQDVTLLHPSDLTFTDLVYRLVALNRLTCTTELTKMLFGTDPFLDGTVILLQDVVQILHWTVAATPS